MINKSFCILFHAKNALLQKVMIIRKCFEQHSLIYCNNHFKYRRQGGLQIVCRVTLVCRESSSSVTQKYLIPSSKILCSKGKSIYCKYATYIVMRFRFTKYNLVKFYFSIWKLLTRICWKIIRRSSNCFMSLLIRVLWRKVPPGTCCAKLLYEKNIPLKWIALEIQQNFFN